MRPPRLPGLPTIAALMLTAMIAAALGIFGPFDLEKIKGWQTLFAAAIGAGGVAGAAYVAVRNVTRQIRIGILGREEDRIERELPGLREARYFSSGFLTYRVTRNFIGLTDAIANDGFGVRGSTPQKDIAKALPNTDQATRLIVETSLQTCFRFAHHAEAAVQIAHNNRQKIRIPNEWEPRALEEVRAEIQRHTERFIEMREGFGRSMDRLEDAVRAFDAKIALYETRSARIRREIEAYFNDGK